MRCHKQLRLNSRLSLRIATQWSQVRIHLDVKVGWVYTENHMRADPPKEVEALATIVRSVVIRLRICEARVPVGHSRTYARSAGAVYPSIVATNVLLFAKRCGTACDAKLRCAAMRQNCADKSASTNYS